jgi:hypothetical protein
VFRSSFLRVSGAILFTALTCAGCGGPDNVGRVSGKVTLDGQPLSGAIVQFEPLAGNSPSGAITDSSGQYSLRYTREVEGAEIGEHRVRITTFSAGDPDAEPPKPRVPEKLPARYNAKTELTAKVERGSNTHDFPLESKGKIQQPKDD